MSDNECLKIPLFISTNAKDASLVTSEKPFSRQNPADRRHRLIFVREGRLLVQIDETPHVVDEGQVLLIRVGNPFTRTHLDNSLLRYYALRFSVSDKSAPDGVSMDVPIVTTLGRPDRVEHLFRAMLDEQSDGLWSNGSHRCCSCRYCRKWPTATRGELAPSELHPFGGARKGAHTGALRRVHQHRHGGQAVDCSPGYLSTSLPRGDKHDGHRIYPRSKNIPRPAAAHRDQQADRADRPRMRV